MKRDSELIAVTFVRVNPQRFPGPGGRFCQSVVIRGQSANRELSFTFETYPLEPQRMEQCLALKELGFTVVKAPNDWRYNYYNNPEKWQDVVIRCAMDRVTLAANADRLGQTVSGYDSDLADTVLESLSKSFPEFVSLAELKYARL